MVKKLLFLSLVLLALQTFSMDNENHIPTDHGNPIPVPAMDGENGNGNSTDVRPGL
jgi:hypothetical protein